MLCAPLGRAGTLVDKDGQVDAMDTPDPAPPVPEHLRGIGGIPGRALWLTEPVRAVLDAGLLVAATPWLAAAKNGDGHGVLVLPGLMASDGSTKPLRAYVRRRGYFVRGWRLGRNLGPTSGIVAGMPGALRELVEKTGGPVSVIGWSLGGIYARELARAHPTLVRQVITLGSPIGVSHGHRTRADRTFRMLSGLHPRQGEYVDRNRLAASVPVPSTALYSKLDGIVGWRSCLAEPSDTHQNVEVHCAHLGFGVDPATLWAVADRLAQPVGHLEPFDPPRALRAFYGSIT